jgi:hypothetical protein
MQHEVQVCLSQFYLEPFVPISETLLRCYPKESVTSVYIFANIIHTPLEIHIYMNITRQGLSASYRML